MYRWIILLLAFSCNAARLPKEEGPAIQTNENMAVLDSIILLAKNYSLFADNVDWETLEKEMKSRLNGDSITAIIEPVNFLFAQLNDFHGALYVNGNRYNSFYKTEYHYPMNMEVVTRINSIGSTVTGAMIDGQIAYLKIPHFYTANQEQIAAYTSMVRSEICDLKSKNPVGWIIDLRLNIGGNMYPMLSGLGELFPDIALGGDSKDGKNFHANWYIQDGNLHMWNSPMTNSEIICNRDKENVNESKKVVFLVGRYTCSSGEAVASSFKGQKNTRLIGETTSGWSSTTAWFPVHNDVVFSPTVAYFMSQDATLHTDGIVPDDLIVEELDIDSLLTNLTLKKGVAWIERK